jgi:hypothetical protein
MDLDTFKGMAWLTEATENSRINEAREKIGSTWGMSGDWYSQEDNVEALFGFLNADKPMHAEDGLLAQNSRPELLDRMDGLPDDGVDEQAAWLEAVTSEIYWVDFWSISGNRYEEPEFSDAYGMNYRYDKLCEVYEWNTDPGGPPDSWLSQEQADQIAAAHQEQLADDGASGSAAVWDSNWEMFYKLDGSGVYHYAHSSDGTSNGEPGEWLSYAQAMQGSGAADPAQAASAPAAEITSLNWVTQDQVTQLEASRDGDWREWLPDELSGRLGADWTQHTAENLHGELDGFIGLLALVGEEAVDEIAAEFNQLLEEMLNDDDIAEVLSQFTPGELEQIVDGVEPAMEEQASQLGG